MTSSASSEKMMEPTGELLLAISSMAHGFDKTPFANWREFCSVGRTPVCDKGVDGSPEVPGPGACYHITVSHSNGGQKKCYCKAWLSHCIKYSIAEHSGVYAYIMGNI